MRGRIKVMLLAAALGVPMVVAAAPVSVASIQELLAVTHAQRLMDGELRQMDALMKQAAHPQMAGRELNAAQQKVMDGLAEKMAALFREDMNWQKMEPAFIKIDRSSFSQEASTAC